MKLGYFKRGNKDSFCITQSHLRDTFAAKTAKLMLDMR